ncbi:glycosyltransferase [Rhodospira trueperi]|uniref:Glycosyltransferase involved in cell wall bisynthesis n=1 Tax=Rhodospira trueperi TaxID=69960 RepID=A0A1G7GR72_9PROT|nr:glycosyltransferase [Rhodospira trueperi]SDE90650.1 Glycosyltransferase involved in cell wall bisynthesis [Rhodospira trueperi]
MSSRPARCIVHVNEADAGGGAQVIARSMVQAARSAGRESWLLVNRKLTDDSAVLPLPDSGGGSVLWRGACRALARFSRRLPYRLGHPLERSARLAEQPVDAVDWMWGREPFHRPHTRKILELSPRSPDVLHAHNLHHGYFDLRVLPHVSRRVPLVLTLHDEWLLTGHCAGTMGCERWTTGCGQCPDLDRYPPLRRDNTAANWRRKADIFKDSRLFVSTPSQWLMARVDRSMVAPAIAERRVIPNGIDTAAFQAGDRAAARSRLRLPDDAHVVLFSANSMRSNAFKDYPTIRQAVRRLTQAFPDRDVILLALGDAGDDPEAADLDVRFLGLTNDQRLIQDAYHAADLYLHAAHTDNFPTTILEALASGLPVVATAVGGIPEQIRALDLPGCDTTNPHTVSGNETGVLVPHRDDGAMARAAETLLTQDDLRHRLSENARRDARDRYDLSVQTRAFMDWYDEIVDRFGRPT